jgi:hypothetical protein
VEDLEAMEIKPKLSPLQLPTHGPLGIEALMNETVWDYRGPSCCAPHYYVAVPSTRCKQASVR